MHFCDSCDEAHYNSTVTFLLDDGKEDEEVKAVTIYTDTHGDTPEQCAIETFYGLVRTINFIEENVTCFDASGIKIGNFKLSDLITGKTTVH